MHEKRRDERRPKVKKKKQQEYDDVLEVIIIIIEYYNTRRRQRPNQRNSGTRKKKFWSVFNFIHHQLYCQCMWCGVYRASTVTCRKKHENLYLVIIMMITRWWWYFVHISFFSVLVPKVASSVARKPCHSLAVQTWLNRETF